MGKSREFREHNLQSGLSPQIAIAGWRGIVSIGARALAGAAEEVGGGKASVSRKNEARKGGNAAARNGRCMASGYLDIYPIKALEILGQKRAWGYISRGRG